jgi:hypothetical protein
MYMAKSLKNIKIMHIVLSYKKKSLKKVHISMHFELS